MVNASALLADLASRLPRRHDGDSLSLEDVPPFYLYDDAAYNFSSLLRCHALRRIAHTAKRERLAEVQLTQLLEAHPMRTTNASRALLFVVPIWEWVSFLAHDAFGQILEKGHPHHPLSQFHVCGGRYSGTIFPTILGGYRAMCARRGAACCDQCTVPTGWLARIPQCGY